MRRTGYFAGTLWAGHRTRLVSRQTPVWHGPGLDSRRSDLLTTVIAIVANNLDDTSSIGEIAAWDAREALERGWRVLAVCQHLDPALSGAVTHVPLYVPPRLHLAQYAVGRIAVQRALAGLRPDVTVTHQPQSAAIADVWNVHYLERAARQGRGPLAPGWRPRVVDAAGAGVARLEDHFVGGLPESTQVVFCSEPLRDAFIRLYDAPPRHTVVPNAAPAGLEPIDRPDQTRRASVVGGHRGPVVGFLGGDDRRKGVDLVRGAVERESDIFAVLAGADVRSPVQERTVEMGRLEDVRSLLAVVDALVVPSRFDPFALVVLEAAAHGVPVIVTATVGSAPLVVEHGAGVLWDGHAPLSPLLREVTARRAHYGAGGLSLARALSRPRLARQRFEEFSAAAERRRRTGLRRGRDR